MNHIALGLSAAFIALSFFRERISRNDSFTQITGAAIIGLIIWQLSGISEDLYRRATDWQDPAIAHDAAIERNVMLNVKAMCDRKGTLPQLVFVENGKAVGYLCRRSK